MEIKTASYDEFLGTLGFTRPPLRGFILSVLKIRQPGNKHYRLVWAFGKRTMFASEKPDEFARKGDAREAGRILAAEKKVDFRP